MRAIIVKSSTFTFALMALFMICTSFQLSDVPGPWEKLGERRVNRRADHDYIKVTAREGDFKAIKLMVRNSGINMDRCVVHFANGDKQEINIRENIPAGGETRIIDLEGKDRYIQGVGFWYDTKGGALNDKAVVVLWGRH